MDSNNTHSPNTESEPRPSALKTLRRFFFVAWHVSPFGAIVTSTPNTHPRTYSHWYPLGEPGAGELHHSHSCAGGGTQFRNRSPLGDCARPFGDVQKYKWHL